MLGQYPIVGEIEDILVRQAMKDPGLKRAIQNEFNFLENMKTWILVN